MENDARQIVLEEFYEVVGAKLNSFSESYVHLEPSDPRSIVETFRQSVPHEQDTISATIRLTGQAIRCQLSVFVPISLVFRFSTVQVTNTTDWVGELANLMLGALKNRFSEFRVHSRMGLPISEHGIQPEFVETQGDVVAVTAKIRNDLLATVLDYHVTDGVRWERDPALATPAEGKFHLF